MPRMVNFKDPRGGRFFKPAAAGGGGGGTATPYRYYRLKITANNGSSFFVGTSELQLRESLGGANAVTGSGGTAAASTVELPAANAFDNDTSTVWVSDNPPSYPEWVRWDFGSGNAKDIIEYRVGSVSNSVDRSATAWTFQGSNDAISWDDLDTVTSVSQWAANELRTYGVTYEYQYGIEAYGALGFNDEATQIGWEFTVGASDITVYALRCLLLEAGEETVRLWRVSDQALIASSAVDAIKSGWAEGALATPVTLSAGVSYVVTTRRTAATIRQYKTNTDVSNFTLSSDLSYVQARLVNADTFPTSTNATWMYGIADIRFAK